MAEIKEEETVIIEGTDGQVVPLEITRIQRYKGEPTLEDLFNDDSEYQQNKNAVLQTCHWEEEIPEKSYPEKREINGVTMGKTGDTVLVVGKYLNEEQAREDTELRREYMQHTYDEFDQGIIDDITLRMIEGEIPSPYVKVIPTQTPGFYHTYACGVTEWGENGEPFAVEGEAKAVLDGRGWSFPDVGIATKPFERRVVELVNNSPQETNENSLNYGDSIEENNVDYFEPQYNPALEPAPALEPEPDSQPGETGLTELQPDTVEVFSAQSVGNNQPNTNQQEEDRDR